MPEFGSPRGRRRAVVAAVIAAVAVAGALLARPRLEEVLRARLEKEAARRGAEVSIGAVRLGLWPPLRLHDVVVAKSGLRFEAKQVDCFWRGRTRLNVSGAALHGPADLSLASQLTAWDLRGGGGSWSLALVKPRPGLVVEHSETPGENEIAVRLSDLAVDRVFDVRRGDRALLEGGMVRGSARLTDAAGVLAFDVDVTSSAARLPALTADGDSDPGLGAPMQVALRASGTLRRPEKTLDVPSFSAAIAGAALSGSLAVHDLGADPSVDLSLEVERADFATLLESTGVGAPAALEAQAGATAGAAPAPGASAPAAGATTAVPDLGSASLSAHAQGRLSDPASFVVTQDVRFSPQARVPPVIARLRGDFVHEAVVENGGSHVVEVAPASPDYIPLDEVPPLFLRTLLLAEDAGFYGHPGIDLRELPSAILTDWARGGAVRGASTITQQLAKNLFLTRDKRVGRKLQEVPLAFLLESSLGKKRILEIYVNVIEWGPGLFGLCPASRAYFGREPRDLTPAQMAFLVCLIPAPVKYQSSFAHGTPGPGLRQLVDALLAKLRSVDALSEEDYRAALGETIVVRGAEAPAPTTPAGSQQPAPPAAAPGNPAPPALPAPPADAPPASPAAAPADPPAAPGAGG